MAKILDQRAAPQRRHVLGGEARRPGRLGSELSDRGRMAHPPRRFQLGELADRLEGVVELPAGQRLAERRLSVDDKVPAGGVVKVAEEHRRPVAEDLYQLRVELGAAPFPRHGHRRFDSAGAAKDLDDIGEVDQPRGR